jgi:opacity protein-like surface antigen
MLVSTNQGGTGLLGRLRRAVELAGVIASISLFLPSLTYAEAWQLDPMVGLEAGYNDNFRLTTQNPAGVFSTIAMGTLGLSRITETMSFQGTLGLDFVKYFGDTEFLKEDNSNQLAAFKASKQGERLNGRLAFSFRRDTLLRTIGAEAAAVQSADSIAIEDDQSVDDGLFIENIRRNRFDVRPSFGYKLTEITQLNLGYRYQNTFYGDAVFSSPNDWDKNTLFGEIDTEISEKNDLLAILSASRFDSESGSIFDNYELQAGVSHDFDETTNATLTLGGRHTVLESSARNLEDNGFVFRLAGRKETGLTRFNGILSRNVTPSAAGDLVKTDSLSFNMTHDLSELLYFRLRSRIFENESLRTQKASGNRRSLTIEPALIWTLTENWSLDALYRYRREKRFDNPDSADSNAVYIILTWRPQREIGK